MIRIFTYVVIVFALAVGFAWLADRPGALHLTWQGYEIETSLLVAAIAIVLAVTVLLLLAAVLRAIVSAPRAVGHYFGARRRDRGYRALSRGMIAVGAGDMRVARRAADESSGLLENEPLTLLLSAQAAQLAGDGKGARTAFEALATKPETRVLGLHGLFVEARRQGENEAARHFAEEAVQAAPKIGWAGEALFEYQVKAGDWLGALRTLGANTEAKLVDRNTSRRLRAVLLTAWAHEIESSDPDEARTHAQEAHRLAPELSEAAVVAGRLLARTGDVRRATKLLEAAWKAAPHPDIAETYAAVRSGDSVRDRLKRVRRLAELRAHNPEGAMAVARAAIDAHDWQAARQSLEGLLRSRPSERVCLLMAEIEEGEHGDEGRVRAWLARAINAPRDPTWVADGRIFARWAPISPVSGRIDAFEWKVASEQLSEPRMPQIDAEPELTLPVDISPAGAETGDGETIEHLPAAEIVAVTPDVTTSAGEPEMPEKPEDDADEAAPEPAEPETTEVPLPRAPDDPGPEPREEAEPGRRFRLFGSSP